ncbi:hypothetical protein LI177_05320 [bacterium 210820-DFI.6.37]|nr:hypothetical protein [bacterium 210820-DFI.6.37]
MASETVLKKRLKKKTSFLEKAYEAYELLLSGQVKSYAIGSRNLTKFDLKELWDMIETLEKEVDSLEEQLAGGSKRKSVAVIPRDL